MRALAGAMDRAEFDDPNAIPCKEHPALWTSDVVAMKGPSAERLIDDLTVACRGCPVIAECTDFAESERAELFGVVAGVRIIHGHFNHVSIGRS